MRQTPFESRRSATMMLLILNVVVFVLECIYYGYPPGGRIPMGDPLALSWWGLSHGYVWQLITFQFLHAGLFHLLGNCLVIFFFGRDLEATLGMKRFLVLYFSSGIIGGLVQALAGGLAVHFGSPQLAIRLGGPTVGASAGALGLIAAFAMLYPERPLMLLLFFIIPVSMRAKFLLLFCTALAIFGILFPVGNLADAAHLGGIATGVLFVRFALNREWNWPRLRHRRGSSPRRLVKISSAKPGLWGRKAGEDDLPAEEFLSKEVDPILDKISAQGIQSLTERERRILETARERMGKR